MDEQIPAEFLKILKETSTTLLDYLSRLLIHCGWDNIDSFSMLTENCFIEMEQFAKTILIELLNENKKTKFFGIFARDPSLFQIPPGHKILIFKLSDRSRSYTHLSSY